MPLFESQQSKNSRFFENALVGTFSKINQVVSDKATSDIYSAWAMGANVMAQGLVVHSKYVKTLWGRGTQEKADMIANILIPAMMSRYYWGCAEQLPTPESRQREFDEQLPTLLQGIFGASPTGFDSFRRDFLNLDVQFNYECDWLQGKATASESDESRWVWDVLQHPKAYALTEKQKSFIPVFFDLQYSLLTSLSGEHLIPHEGTPIIFESVLWHDKCAQALGGEQSIQWSSQEFPIQGAGQLVPTITSSIRQLSHEDFVGWCASVKTGTEAMLRYLPTDGIGVISNS